jgi:hypothetical protein
VPTNAAKLLIAVVAFFRPAVFPQTVTIDATKPSQAVLSNLPMGGTSPSGHTIAVNNRYLTLDGKPWLPVMGEFHYSRYPEQYWEEQLLKMKAGGVQIVSTYVFWIHHEEIEGQFDWSGRRDLRHFIELCQKYGLYAHVRIGPYAHGEVRNGGLPDWIFAKGPVRKNDPVYLSCVRRYFAEIGTQLKGLFWQMAAQSSESSWRTNTTTARPPAAPPTLPN